jgi:P27 family predicted phage terminase small subunit
LAGEALTAWDSFAAILKKSKRARTVDSYLLATLCMAWDMLQKSYALIQTEGMTQDAYRKRELSAAAKAAKEAAELVRALASEFGFSPLGRSKIKPDAGTSTAQQVKAEPQVEAEIPRFQLSDFVKKGA